MSKIAKDLFEKDKKRWLEGYDSLEAYNDDYTGFEGHLHGYFLILNPDTGDAFDDKLNKLEMEYGMVTIAPSFLKESKYFPHGSVGFNSNGESVRVAMFSSNHHAPNGSIDENKIREILGEVFYDLHKFH